MLINMLTCLVVRENYHMGVYREGIFSQWWSSHSLCPVLGKTPSWNNGLTKPSLWHLPVSFGLFVGVDIFIKLLISYYFKANRGCQEPGKQDQQTCMCLSFSSVTGSGSSVTQISRGKGVSCFLHQARELSCVMCKLVVWQEKIFFAKERRLRPVEHQRLKWLGKQLCRYGGRYQGNRTE